MRRATWKELGLAALAGVVAAVSPISSHETLPSVIAGVAVGGAVLGYRLRRLPAPVQPERTTHAQPGALPATSPVPAGVIAAGLLYATLFAPTAAWLYRQWTAGVWVNNHGLFVPLLVGYLVVTTLRRDPIPGAESSPWGLPLVGLGALLAAIDAGMGNQYLSVLGLLVTLPGLSLVLLGPRRTRVLAVPLAVSLLAMPIPNTVASHLYLRQITSVAVEEILHALGIAALRESTVILTAHHSFVVSDACSGFATLYASVAVAVLLACYSRSHWRRVLLLLAAVPLALAANAVRVFLLVVICDHFGAWLLDTPIHEASGVATFGVVLAAFFFLADRQGLRRGMT